VNDRNRKGTKMVSCVHKLSVCKAALYAACCLLLFADISLAVSAEELQRIENAAPAKPTVEPKQPRKLLVFNLCNDYKHGSIPYWDKALEIMGQKTGAYTTVISNDMSMFEAENLARFDAVCLNNTTKLKFSNDLRQSLMAFVKGGNGFVGIHAATDNFYDWPEAAEMIGGQFSGHPWTGGGTWAVKIDDPQHPLTAAFEGKGFKIKDEIYRTEPPLYSRSKQRVLLSLDMTDSATSGIGNLKPGDMDTGISWVKSYGEGRVFYCSLGHNPELAWNPAILRHYLDGIQFALGDFQVDTTPTPYKTLDDVLAEVARYDFGRSRLPLTELTERITAAHKSPEKLKEVEKRLVEFLKSDATPAAKQFICRQLSIVGTGESVPVLASMLTEKPTSAIVPADSARYALERIPGAEADKALRDALDKTSGKVKVGIINSLGARGDEEAVGQLAELVAGGHEQIAEAAVSALGKIGGKKAADVLGRTCARGDGHLRLTAASAYLACGDKFLAAGNKNWASRIYRRVFKMDLPSPIRAAALRGMVAVEPKKAAPIILDGIKSDDELMRAAAIACLRQTQDSKVVEAAIKNLAALSGAAQVQVISALADRDEGSAMKVVAHAAKSDNAEVRVAALAALGRIGDASTVALLAEAAATGSGAQQQAARQSLYSLSAPDVDKKILAGIAQAEDSRVRVELIRSAAERNITDGADLLLKTARDEHEEIRLESTKALKVVAGETHIPALAGLVVYATDPDDRREAENTLAGVALKIPDESRRAGRIVTILREVDNVQARCSLRSPGGAA
jgi:type 1 glutamine amidotransferase/HEAT repeat protein